MRFGVLGTGIVGQTLAGKLVSLGHEVTMGSRQAGNEKAVAWANEAGEAGHEGTFADAARFGEIVVNATGGAVSLDALNSAGAENLSGKVLIDVSNPLDFSQGFPPTLTVCNTDSVGEQIQREFPDAKVVKTLNTVNAGLMVAPGSISERHTVFVAGNDDDAKAQVRDVLVSFGWPAEDVLDLGDISTSRGTEMYLPLWLRLANATGSWMVNVKVVTPKG
jgi:8-hydroxy-5-deazaflavin:NADPH oxidoreductase